MSTLRKKNVKNTLPLLGVIWVKDKLMHSPCFVNEKSFDTLLTQCIC